MIFPVLSLGAIVTILGIGVTVLALTVADMMRRHNALIDIITAQRCHLGEIERRVLWLESVTALQASTKVRRDGPHPFGEGF